MSFNSSLNQAISLGKSRKHCCVREISILINIYLLHIKIVKRFCEACFHFFFYFKSTIQTIMIAVIFCLNKFHPFIRANTLKILLKKPSKNLSQFRCISKNRLTSFNIFDVVAFSFRLLPFLFRSGDMLFK